MNKRLCLAFAVLWAGCGIPLSRAAGPTTQKSADSLPDFNDVIKDMNPQEGLFTLYRYKADDSLKDQTRLLCVIPRSMMNQDMLLATTISRGPMAGFEGDDYLIRFEQMGRHVVISVPDERYVQTPGQPVTDSVARTYTPGFLADLPLVTETPGGDPVVDLSALCLGQAVTIPIPSGTEVRRDLSHYSKIKTFPENVMIDVDLATANRFGVGDSVGISYAFRKLPALGGYEPRIADERVGYFTTVRQDWNAKQTQRENLIRYINRWQLEKKDPSLDLSPPKKPIVFIIEKTVPLQWRKYVAEGISEWNRAFEQIGFQDAIVVQQQTDDNEYADVDPEDARYNFIRWIVTGTPFAMGPSRADPRTGQILDADIVFDDSMLRYYLMDFDIFSPSAMGSVAGPELGQFFKANPAFLPAGQKLDTDARQASADSWLKGQAAHDSAGGELLHPLATRGSLAESRCNYADGLKHQLALMQLALVNTADGKKIPERFIGEAIKEVVTHEVGHTLGLRHNFKASSWLSMDEIKKRRDSGDEPLVASVMDYNPLLFFPGDDPQKVRHFITPCIGPYDEWAIQYGYRIAGKDDGDEKDMIAKIASQNTKRELAYATDEDTMGLSSPDPLVNRFDMSDDPIAWAKSRIDLVDGLMKNLSKWALPKDQPEYYLRSIFQTLMYEKAINLEYVSRLVGGQSYSRNRPADPQAAPVFTLLPAERQREAIKTLNDTIFSDQFVSVDPALWNQLGPSRWWDWASTPSRRIDYPAHQMILSLQAYTLFNLVSPQVLQRVYDAELKSTESDKFTAAELLQSIRKSIWGDLQIPADATYTDAKPMLSSIRRNLQKQWLQFMVASVDVQPGSLTSPDLQSMVRFTLRDLSDQIAAALDSAKRPNNQYAIDFATRAHLTECKSEIDRVLNAPHLTLPMFYGMSISEDGQKH